MSLSNMYFLSRAIENEYMYIYIVTKPYFCKLNMSK